MKDGNITWLTVRFNVFMFIVATVLLMSSNSASANEWHRSQIYESGGSISSPVIAVDGNSVAHLAWIARINYPSDYALYYANSKDNWLPVTITNISESYTSPSIFVDRNNSVYIAWISSRTTISSSGSRSKEWDVHYASSLDGWVTHIVKAGSTFPCYNPSIVVDNGGDIYITFTRSGAAFDRSPYNTKLFLTKKSSGWMEERISFTGYSNIGWSDMDIDNNDVVHVVFSNNVVAGDPTSNKHIWYANSANNWVNVQIDSDATLNSWDNRQYPSIDVDSNNTAHVVWRDQRNADPSGVPVYEENGVNYYVNRAEIYYANDSNNWINSEIALPLDTAGPRVKRTPSIFVQNNIVHATWIQKENGLDYAQENLYYSNSNNWGDAVNITNLPDIPICYIEYVHWTIIDPYFSHYGPSYSISSSMNGLSIDNNGILHAAWIVTNNKNHSTKMYYATYSPFQSCDCADPRAMIGTSDPDFLFGTSHSDIICGFGGQDFIVGQGGNDCIDGGDGDDWIFGGIGNDKLYGGEGYDLLFCGGGTDIGGGEYSVECEN